MRKAGLALIAVVVLAAGAAAAYVVTTTWQRPKTVSVAATRPATVPDTPGGAIPFMSGLVPATPAPAAPTAMASAPVMPRPPDILGGASPSPLAPTKATVAAFPPGPDLIWGVNGHPFTAYPGVSLETQLDALKGMGMTHYRVNLRPDGSIDGLSRLLPLAAKRGITIVPVLSVDVDFVKDTPQRIYAKSYEIGHAMAKRYVGRIKVWELGNELENYAILQPCEMRDDGTKYPCEWGPAGGVGELEYFGPRWRNVSAALRGLSEGVHAGDPAALRAMGTAGWGHLGAFDRMAKDGLQWDISVWHQYSPGGDDSFKHIANFGKPIWITEFNFDGGSAKGEDKQAQGLTDMMTRHREIRTLYGVQAVFVYELFDEPYWTDIEARMGLIHLTKNSRGFWQMGTPKPAAEAVSQLIARGPQGSGPTSLQ